MSWPAAKGHDYVTVVYDLDTDGLLWIGDGRSVQWSSLGGRRPNE